MQNKSKSKSVFFFVLLLLSFNFSTAFNIFAEDILNEQEKIFQSFSENHIVENIPKNPDNSVLLNSKSLIDELYNENQYFPSPVKPKDRPSVALILSGGGARGFAHLPILEMIEEYDIPVDIIIGTSIGSIIGGIYSAGYSIEEMEKQFFSLNWSEIFQDKIPELYETRFGKATKTSTPFSIDFKKTNSGFNLNLGSGILTGQYAYELIKKMTLAIPSDCDFDSLPIPFRAVTVNLTSGNIEVFKKGDLAEAIRASMSIPTFFNPFEIDGQYYIDGGTRNNTPIDIAVKMGYDIIIVSEISSTLVEDYESFKTNPLEALKQMTNLEQAVRNRDIYKKASLVMFPDYNNCTILDFAKSRQIYQSSKESIQKYRNDFEQIKNQIESKRSGKKSENKSSYNENSLPYVTTVSVTGGNEQDKFLVERAFSNIRNTQLTSKSYTAFEKSIYKSGRYDTVLTRINKINSRDSNIEVILSKKEEKDFRISLGMEYKGTLTTNAMNDVTMQTQIRKENFLGKGSILALSGSFLTDYLFSFDYIQPFGSFAFTQFSLTFENDRSIVSSGFDYSPLNAEQMNKNVAEFSVGLPVSNWFTLTLGANLGLYDTKEKIPGGKSYKAADFFARQSINLLDFNCLPSKGFLLDFMGETVFPFEDLKNDYESFDVEQLLIEAIIPAGEKTGILLKGFAGGNLNEKLSEYSEMLPVFGFNTADRSFFPQIAATTEYGLYKAAFAGGFIFSPWDQLTILGGKAFFGITGAYGNIWQKKDTLPKDSVLWRTSADIGIRFSDSFGIVLRGGVGKTCGDIYPFFSVDLGKVRL